MTPQLGTILSIEDNDTDFMMNGANYSSLIPKNAQGAPIDLNKIGGSGLDELWIAGQGGVLLRWPNTAFSTPPTALFPKTDTGTTADLSSLSGFGGNLFFGGSNMTLGYVGPLFKPN